MLEKLAEYFYNPLVFWSIPLVLVVLIVGWRRVSAWRLGYLAGRLSSNGSSGDSSRPGNGD